MNSKNKKTPLNKRVFEIWWVCQSYKWVILAVKFLNKRYEKRFDPPTPLTPVFDISLSHKRTLFFLTMASRNGEIRWEETNWKTGAGWREVEQPWHDFKFKVILAFHFHFQGDFPIIVSIRNCVSWISE